MATIKSVILYSRIKILILQKKQTEDLWVNTAYGRVDIPGHTSVITRRDGFAKYVKNTQVVVMNFGRHYLTNMTDTLLKHLKGMLMGKNTKMQF